MKNPDALLLGFLTLAVAGTAQSQGSVGVRPTSWASPLDAWISRPDHEAPFSSGANSDPGHSLRAIEPVYVSSVYSSPWRHAAESSFDARAARWSRNDETGRETVAGPALSSGLDAAADPDGSGLGLGRLDVPAGLESLDPRDPHGHVEPSSRYGDSSIPGDFAGPRRDFARMLLQPRVRLGGDVFAMLRYSEIGTHEGDGGPAFGDDTEGPRRRLCYRTKLMQRVSAGVGWEISPSTYCKVEVGHDWFDLVDGAPFRQDSRRTFYGFQVALSF